MKSDKTKFDDPGVLVEEGAAISRLKELEPEPRAEQFDVIVIGAGQAGLSAGYHLKQRGMRFVILDASPRIGDAWRNRWDSLRLFTPARFDGLDGMRFPAPRNYFPTKDEMGDFLESYARHFDLPVRSNVRVDELRRDGDRYVVSAGERRFEADHVIVAMSNYQRPMIPEFASQLDRDIVQMHSIDYRSPAQLREGSVLLVGAGNTGSELAMEFVRNKRHVWMSGRDTGEIPFRIEGFAGRHLLVDLVLKVLFYRVLTVDTPLGRKVRPKVISSGGPLIRVKKRDLVRAGVERVPRVEGVRDGKPVLADGRVLDPPNVIWCTGFHPGFSWIKRDIFEASGHPRHVRGVAEGEPGLYFLGLEFLYAMSSIMVQGVGRDARYIVDRIAERVAA